MKTGLDPFVVPMVDYNHVGMPDGWGGRFALDANVQSIYRIDGTRDQDWIEKTIRAAVTERLK